MPPADVGGDASAVLRGPKAPFWTCGFCGTDAQWASRTECRNKQCKHAAPQKVIRAARQADAESKSSGGRTVKIVAADKPGSPTQRTETQRLRRELIEKQKEIDRMRVAAGSSMDVDAGEHDTTDSDVDNTIAQYEKAIAAFDPKCEATASVRDDIKQKLAALRADKSAKQPGHVRRQHAMQRRRRQQESLQAADRQIQETATKVSGLQAEIVDLQAKSTALAEKRAALQVSIAALDGEIAELSASLAQQPAGDRYTDLPDELAQQYRALDALASQARAAAEANIGGATGVAAGAAAGVAAGAAATPPQDVRAGGGSAELPPPPAPPPRPSVQLPGDTPMEEVGIPDDDSLLDQAMQSVGIGNDLPGVEVSPAIKRVLLQTFNYGVKRHRPDGG